MSHAFQNRMSSESTGERADAFNCGLATLTNYIGGAELARQRHAVGMSPEHDDLLRAQAACGNHSAQTDGAITDDSNDLTGARLRGACSMVPGPHHVGEREQ